MLAYLFFARGQNIEDVVIKGKGFFMSNRMAHDQVNY